MLLVGLIIGALLIIAAIFIYKRFRNTLPGGTIRPETATSVSIYYPIVISSKMLTQNCKIKHNNKL